MNEPRKLLIESDIKNDKPRSDLSRRGFLRKSAGAAAAVSAPTLVGLGGLLSSGSAMAWGGWTTSYIDYRDSWMENLYGYPNGVGLWRYLLNEYGYGDTWVSLEIQWRVASAGGHIQANIFFQNSWSSPIGHYIVDYYLDSNDYLDSNTNLDVSQYPAVVTNVDTRDVIDISPTEPVPSAKGEFRRRLQDSGRYKYWVHRDFKAALNFMWNSSHAGGQFTRTITNRGSDYLGADSIEITFHSRLGGGTNQDIVYRFFNIPSPGHEPIMYWAYPLLNKQESAVTKLQSNIGDAQANLRDKAQQGFNCMTSTTLAGATIIAASTSWTGLGISAGFATGGIALAAGAALLVATNYAISGQTTAGTLSANLASARSIANSWYLNTPVERTPAGIFRSLSRAAEGYDLIDLQWYMDNLNTPSNPNFGYLFDL